MPLGTKTATTTELWTPVMNKTTGQPYAGLEKCSSLERLEQENKALSDLLDEKLNAWMDQDESNEKKLQDFKIGFQYKHTDGYTYKIVQFKNGEHALSRSKGFGGAGGAGGYRRTGTTYVHLRTVIAKVCRVEQVADIIDNQADNDNWEIIQLQADAKGDKFLLLNKKPYTPTAESATNVSKEETSKDEKETDNQGSDAEETTVE